MRGRKWSFALSVLALFGLGLWMRLHDLGLPYDRDGYDEGVYWQSLRAMAAGHRLYGEVFHSQPPVFLLSVYPFYMLFGRTLWAARLGVAVMSMAAPLGAFLFVRAIAGRLGALAALALLVADPLYLSQSQRIEAEAPQVALSMLAIGLACTWWENRKGLAGLAWGACAGATLALSILSKLLGVAALAPFGLLTLAQLRQVFHQPAGLRLACARSLLAGVAGFLGALIVVLLPFAGSFHSFVDSVVTFHVAAGVDFENPQQDNFERMLPLLTSASAFIALSSTIIAIIRDDLRVVPILTWLGATVLMLEIQTPFFDRHLVALIPPILSLTVFGINPIRRGWRLSSIAANTATTITLVAILFVVGTNWERDFEYYVSQRNRSLSDNMGEELEAALDLREATLPGQLVITDDQFAAGLADRSTPPELVDTSFVRIQTKYLTAEQLLRAASRPDVHAVVFYTGRLRDGNLNEFYRWIVSSRLFQLRRRYTPWEERELWIKE